MSDGGESAGALGTLFFYVLFVHPVCAWILAPKRFRKDRAIVYAILFLAAVAIGKLVRAEREREEHGVAEVSYMSSVSCPAGALDG